MCSFLQMVIGVLLTYLLTSQENLIFVYTYIAYIMSTYYKQYSITCVYVTF